MIASRAAFGVALAALVLLAGCGQKGPLYMPGDEQAAEQYDPADAYEPAGAHDPDSADAERRPAQSQPAPTEGSADSADDTSTTNGNAASVTTRGAGE